jgi:hypothetical protein
MRIRDELKSPDVVFSALVAAVAVVVSTVMAAAIASTLVAILVFIIGAAARIGMGLRVPQPFASNNPGATVT